MNNQRDDGPSPGIFDAEMLMELVEAYAQTMRGHGKAWLDLWSLAARGAPPDSNWIDEGTRILSRWRDDMVDVSGGWWPGARWFDRDLLPAMSFCISRHTEAAGPREIPLSGLFEGNVPIQTTPLRLLGKVGKDDLGEINAKHVRAEIIRRRLTLRVSLNKLNELKPTPVESSQYLGCAYVAGAQARPLALIYVMVTGDAKPPHNRQ